MYSYPTRHLVIIPCALQLRMLAVSYGVPLTVLIITQRATKAHNISRTATNLNTFDMLMQINAGRNFQGNFDFWHSKDPDFHNDLRPATEVSRLCG